MQILSVYVPNDNFSSIMVIFKLNLPKEHPLHYRIFYFKNLEESSIVYMLFEESSKEKT